MSTNSKQPPADFVDSVDLTWFIGQIESEQRALLAELADEIYGPWLEEQQAARGAKPACQTCTETRGAFGPSHNGRARCTSGSIASGGTRPHCACDICF